RRRPRTVGAGGRAGRVGPPHRPVRVRGVPPPDGQGPGTQAGGAGPRAADHRPLRVAAAGGADAYRPARGAWRPQGGGGQRAHEAAPGSDPWDALVGPGRGGGARAEGGDRDRGGGPRGPATERRPRGGG